MSSDQEPLANRGEAAPNRSGAANGGFAIAVAGLLALHLAKAWLFFAGGQAPLKWDSLGYWQMAKRLVAGERFPESLSVHRTPGYPAFLALHQAAFGEGAHAAAVATQLLCVVLAALATAFLCGRLARSRAAFLVGLALPLGWMEASYLSLYLLSDVLLAALVAAFVAALVHWMDRPTPVRSFGAGVLLGVGMLVKPVMQLAWVPVLVGMAYRLFQTEGERRGRAVAVHLGAFGLALAVSVGPWLLHNRSVHGEAFLTKFVGRSLWMSTFGPGGARLELPDTEDARLIRTSASDPTRSWGVSRALVARGASAVEADDAMRDVAVEAIRREPARFVSSIGDRWLQFWTTHKRHGYWKNNDFLTRDARPVRHPYEVEAIADLHESTLDRLRLEGSVHLLAPILALLGALAMCRVPELRPAALVLIALIAYLSLVIATAIVPLYRYRVPIDPLVIAPAVAGAFALLRARRAPPP
jgi:hypothetical protein